MQPSRQLTCFFPNNLIVFSASPPPTDAAKLSIIKSINQIPAASSTFHKLTLRCSTLVETDRVVVGGRIRNGPAFFASFK